ncbi:uncharacterized protein BCR38DRAFT_445683 [Pseudomassariella vexata]|uniref:Uncharacterized protein n=1 Tax=Pseudomassariella vexata TaxID=1141098 RepID=A0A1Y2DIR6_9PEZI|nr:uncharacterized protein BCR38DRAFT_445683 [Pseudomassariella vexata]ORY59123.1 hypothetical protein BCR38DRAFT_445683 [Pseudomassariella vexata]
MFRAKLTKHDGLLVQVHHTRLSSRVSSYVPAWLQVLHFRHRQPTPLPSWVPPHARPNPT